MIEAHDVTAPLGTGSGVPFFRATASCVDKYFATKIKSPDRRVEHPQV
jgi:hypothetical protein